MVAETSRIKIRTKQKQSQNTEIPSKHRKAKLLLVYIYSRWDEGMDIWEKSKDRLSKCRNNSLKDFLKLGFMELHVE